MNHSEEVKSKIDIVDFISQYLKLTPAGSNFRAICPFHNEKTPSFMVSPDKQIWHCFGCGKGGDVFSFLMEMEGLDFIEALKVLADKVGVVLKSSNFSENKNKNRLLEILDLSARYYNFILTNDKVNNEAVQKIKKYLANRGLNQEAINRWSIGYSLDNYSDLINFLKSKKYTDSEILSSGMAIKSEQGRYYNRFRDRIMFPIKDVNGRVVAFTARINPESKTNEAKSFGKYINSPQTDLYDKSRILFALEVAKTAIREQDEAVVVEGQMDAISAHEAGFKNVVASSGTALTTSQLSLIKRYTSNISLSFDQDLAGSTATDRGVAEALRGGLNLKIISFPDSEQGKDPDDIIRSSPDTFARAVAEAKNIIEYYLEKETKSIDLKDVKQKNKSVNKILTVINMLSNKVEQDFWVKELSQKYVINESFLREALVKIEQNTNKNSGLLKKNDNHKNIVQAEDIVQKNREDKLAELLIALSLRFPQNFDYLSNKLELKQIPPKYKKYYELLLIYGGKNNKNLDYQQFLDYSKSKDESGESESFFNKMWLLADHHLFSLDSDQLEDSAKKEILNIIIEIKRWYYKNLIKQRELELISFEKNKEKGRMADTLEALKDLNDKLSELS